MLILSTIGLERVVTKMQEVGWDNMVLNTALPRPGLGQQASSVRPLWVGLLSGKEFPVRISTFLMDGECKASLYSLMACGVLEFLFTKETPKLLLVGELGHAEQLVCGVGEHPEVRDAVWKRLRGSRCESL